MRAPSLAVVALLAFLGAPVAAQTGRLQGVVRDTNGQPIKGAVVKAMHPQAQPREFTAITDDKGRFAMIGLRSATTWQFVVTAPGYYEVEAESLVRTQIGQPLSIVMRRDPGPIPGALVKDIQDQLAAAQALRDAGRYDQAIAAYQSIHRRNGRLSAVNLVLADVYRARAKQESDAAARRALLEKAVAAYDALLQDDSGHERATTERAATLAELTE
jgi:tetratricopeptide (TPR) repeat protein